MVARAHPAPAHRTMLPRPVTEAIEVLHLRKAYGPVVAVDDVSFSVAEGEIFGMLGPKRAGKTTTVECVIGLRTLDAGLIRVMGLDPHREREGLHAIVAVWAICFAEGDGF
jgi:ABC-2 type transport system ATP-binding protein